MSRGGDAGAAGAGRDDRFRRLYEAHHFGITAYVSRRLQRSDVDDVVSAVFLVTWRRIDDVPDEPLTAPWLYRVARYVASDSQRTRRRQDRLIARLQNVTVHDAEDGRGSHADPRLDVAFERLNSADRHILWLTVCEQLDGRELAETLGCSYSAARVRLHRARQRLAENYHHLLELRTSADERAASS